MAKEYLVIVDNKVLYEPGHYEVQDAVNIARSHADRNRGVEVHVVHIEHTYYFEKDTT
jgi:hypothetical protein